MRNSRASCKYTQGYPPVEGLQGLKLVCSDLALEAQQRVDWHQNADSNYLDHKTINYTTK